MSNIVAIAYNTFREAIRNKVLYLILLFLIFMIAFSFVLGSLSFEENDRVIKNFAHMSITIFGLLVAIFVGVIMICDELDRRTIYTVVANGVRRHEFLLGKYFGVLFTIVVNAFVMTAVFYLLLWLAPALNPGSGLVVSISFAQAVFISLFEIAIVTAFAVWFSSFSTPILSAILTFFVWTIGRGAELILELQNYFRHHPDKSPGMFFQESFLPFLYYLLPNLEALNHYSHFVAQETFFPITWTMVSDVAQAAGYTAVILILACVTFSRRDFK